MWNQMAHITKTQDKGWVWIIVSPCARIEVDQGFWKYETARRSLLAFAAAHKFKLTQIMADSDKSDMVGPNGETSNKELYDSDLARIKRSEKS